MAGNTRLSHRGAIQVAYEEGSIHISLAPQTESEPAMVCDTKAGYASKEYSSKNRKIKGKKYINKRPWFSVIVY